MNQPERWTHALEYQYSSTDAAKRQAMSFRTTHDAPAERPRILVLDDDDSIFPLIRRALPDRNFALSFAKTVDQAISLLQDRPALVLVDLRLPAGSGWDLVDHVREHGELAATPIVILTGSDDEADRKRSLAAGADRFVQKPFSPQHLRRVVSHLLAARDPYWWSLSLGPESLPRLQQVAFDPVSELPTLAYVAPDLIRGLENGDCLAVFCVGIEPLFRLGERIRWQDYDQLRRRFARGLQILSPLTGSGAIIAASHASGDDFFVFVPIGKGVPVPDTRQLEAQCRQILDETDRSLAEDIALFVGRGETARVPAFGPRVLYDAVHEAKSSVERRETSYRRALTNDLLHALRNRTLRTVFQPILELTTLEVFGFEALTRGPAGSEIESPEVIFDLARDLDLVWQLEVACIGDLRSVLHDVCGRGVLFFNAEAQFIQQLDSRGLEVLEPLLDCRSTVVVEVTERSAIRDYSMFRRTLRDLQRLGFRVAVDDCGSGYATLEAVAELKPDYLKVGHSLLHDVDEDPVRLRVVELVSQCAGAIGAEVIAEAIETSRQLDVCRQLNIRYGQGFLFAHPASWDVVATQRIAPSATAE